MSAYLVYQLLYMPNMGNLRARLLCVIRDRCGQLHSSRPVCAGPVAVQMMGHVKPTGQVRNHMISTATSTNALSPSASAASINCQGYHSFASHECVFSWVCIHNKLNKGLPVKCFSSQNSGTDDLVPEEALNTPGSGSQQKAESDTPHHSEYTVHGQENSGATQCLEDQRVLEPRLGSSPSGVSSSMDPAKETASHAFVPTAIPDSSNISDQQTALDPQIAHDRKSETERTPTPRELQDLQDLPPPKPMEPSYNLAPYVAKSEVLQRLVSLGVDLSVVEKVSEAADFVVQANWDADIQPRLLFLQDVGVEDAKLGHVLTKNPLLLKEDMEDMQVRVNYLQSKKFNQEQISRIVTSAPLTLLMPVTLVDKKLGFLQNSFHLTGNEVRHVTTRLPKIIPWKLQKLKDLRFYMKEMLGFSDQELKAMLLATPKVYLSDKHQLGKRFDFLHNVMGLSHQHLVTWPAVFRSRLHILQQRHRFLLLMGRAQYDPTKENYVSLKALVSGRDQDFCFHVAKASTTQFNNFLKTL